MKNKFFHDALTAPGTALDLTLVDACIADFEACSLVSDTCSALVPGGRALGEPCALDNQCPAAASCHGAVGACGTCAADPVVGEACTTDATLQCAENLVR